MPRSAAQRAARRLKRHSMPVFPFTKLPAELQLLIFCKCDMISIKRLLKVSPFVRSLFLRYPENALRDMLAELPTPVANLIRVSWALARVNNQTFDAEKTLDLLHNVHLLEWPRIYRSILAGNEDPLEAVHNLVNLYSELDTATRLIAQGMNAAVEHLVNPNVVLSGFVLSATEHTRIASSLLLLTIYLQLRVQLSEASHDWSSPFPLIFLRSQQPWLIEQAVSVESFLRACFGDPTSIYSMIDKRYTCKECLSEKSLTLRDYFQQTGMFGLSARFTGPVAFYYAALGYRSSGIFGPLWQRLPSDFGQTSNTQDLTKDLRNEGWMIYETLMGVHRLPAHAVQNLLSSLGFFFWDHERLMAWDLTTTTEVRALFEYFQTQLNRGNNNWQTHRTWNFIHGPSFEKIKAYQITQWTRCFTFCTLEEFLYQKTALVRVAQGRPPLPGNYIEPGVICLVCGEDGHRGIYCQEENWPDREYLAEMSTTCAPMYSSV